jgi:hypothetical protein
MHTRFVYVDRNRLVKKKQYENIKFADNVKLKNFSKNLSVRLRVGSKYETHTSSSVI